MFGDLLMLNKKLFCIIIMIIFLLNLIPIASSNNQIDKNETRKYVTVENIDGIWWFVDSDGNKFFANGISNVIPSPYYYDEIELWADQTNKHLKEYGINTITANMSLFPDFFYLARFRFKHLSNLHSPGWSYNKHPKCHNRIPDVFDPFWQREVENATEKYATRLRNDTNLIGYYTDNEMKWGPDIQDEFTMLEVYMSAGNNTPGKQELIRFLRDDQYNGDIVLFNRVWNMDLNCFEELNDYREFGLNDAWRLRSNLFFQKIMLLKNPVYSNVISLLKQAEKDVRNFSRNVAYKYFNVTNTALKKADPNHLNIGTRFHLFGVPIEVLEECGKHVDVISVNYYRTNIKIYDPINHYTSLKYGCVPLDNWMKKYNEITGKPLIVSEWNMKLKDRIFPIFTGDNRFSGRRTKDLRSDNFEWYVMNSLKSSHMTGIFWFYFRDNHFGNSGSRGIVNLFDEYDEELVKSMKKIHPKSNIIHEGKFDDRFIKSFFSTEADLKIIGEKNFYENKKNEGNINTINYKIQNDIKKPRTIYVDDNSVFPFEGSIDHPYQKIQYAIDNSNDGDIIRVFEGEYNEKININKKIEIIGNNSENTIISGFLEDNLFIGPNSEKYNNYVITINSDNVKIKNFKIITGKGFYEDSSSGVRKCNGILIDNSDDIVISDNLFDNIYNGVECYRSDRTSIFDNDMEVSSIIFDSSTDSNISDNKCMKIWVSQSKNIEIKNNKISDNKWGILLFYTDDSIIDENRFEKIKEIGLFLKESNNNTICNNDFVKKEIKKTGMIMFNIQEYLFYEHATFLNSENNIWNNNFWEKPRILPKIIFGRKGDDGLIFDLNYDKNPSKNMNT